MNHDEKLDLKISTRLLDELTRNAEKMNRIPFDLYQKYSVKRGLRNDDGTGVLVGLTEIGDVHGYIIDEGEIVPVDGRLEYRGINVQDITNGFQAEKRYGFEEVCYLLEGRVKVTPSDSEAVEFGSGDLVTFPRGMKCIWTIIEAVRKHYTFR